MGDLFEKGSHDSPWDEDDVDNFMEGVEQESASIFKRAKRGLLAAVIIGLALLVGSILLLVYGLTLIL